MGKISLFPSFAIVFNIFTYIPPLLPPPFFFFFSFSFLFFFQFLPSFWTSRYAACPSWEDPGPGCTPGRVIEKQRERTNRLTQFYGLHQVFDMLFFSYSETSQKWNAFIIVKAFGVISFVSKEPIELSLLYIYTPNILCVWNHTFMISNIALIN